MVPFPEVFVINLDFRADRWAGIQQSCTTAELIPIRIPAVQASLGWKGCTLSHLKCVRLAKERNLPWVLILEDDATFTPESINRFRKLLPYLWENREKWERFNGGPTFPPDPTLRVLSREPPIIYARGFASHFSLINSRAYDIILEWDPERDRVIDVFYMSLESKFRTIFNSVATFPHISVQAVSRSDISPDPGKGVNDYSTYFRYSEIKLRECLSKQT